MQVDEVTVSLVDDPRVGSYLIKVGTGMWTDQTLALASILVSLVICHLNLELDVISNV